MNTVKFSNMYREIENLIHYIFPLSEALSGSSCLGLSRLIDLKYSVNCLTDFVFLFADG